MENKMCPKCGQALNQKGQCLNTDCEYLVPDQALLTAPVSEGDEGEDAHPVKLTVDDDSVLLDSSPEVDLGRHEATDDDSGLDLGFDSGNLGALVGSDPGIDLGPDSGTRLSTDEPLRNTVVPKKDTDSEFELSLDNKDDDEDDDEDDSSGQDALDDFLADIEDSGTSLSRTKLCVECGQPVTSGVCRNVKCDKSPDFAADSSPEFQLPLPSDEDSGPISRPLPRPTLCLECDKPFLNQDGVCHNEKCPESPDYVEEEIEDDEEEEVEEDLSSKKTGNDDGNAADDLLSPPAKKRGYGVVIVGVTGLALLLATVFGGPPAYRYLTSKTEPVKADVIPEPQGDAEKLTEVTKKLAELSEEKGKLARDLEAKVALLKTRDEEVAGLKAENGELAKRPTAKMLSDAVDALATRTQERDDVKAELEKAPKKADLDKAVAEVARLEKALEKTPKAKELADALAEAKKLKGQLDEAPKQKDLDDAKAEAARVQKALDEAPKAKDVQDLKTALAKAERERDEALVKAKDVVPLLKDEDPLVAKLKKLSPVTTVKVEKGVTQMKLSEDGKSVVLGTDTGKILVYSMGGGAPTEYKGLKGKVTAVVMTEKSVGAAVGTEFALWRIGAGDAPATKGVRKHDIMDLVVAERGISIEAKKLPMQTLAPADAKLNAELKVTATNRAYHPATGAYAVIDGDDLILRVVPAEFSTKK